MRLDGKRIIVTGAAGGIGFSTAKVLIQSGARVALVDLDPERLKKAQASISSSSAITAIANVSSASSVAAMIDKVVSIFGGLDGIFNNAGIISPEDGDVAETDEDVWDRVIAVNLKSVYLCCRYAIPALLKSGNGAIVNNASIVALMGSFPSQIAYTASKGGIVSMTREIGVAYARQGIRANSVLPGVTDTAMSDVVKTLASSPDAERRMDHVPMGRYGHPIEIGNVVAFLLSDSAAYVTAQSWPVDGGLTSAYLCPPSVD